MQNLLCMYIYYTFIMSYDVLRIFMENIFGRIEKRRDLILTIQSLFLLFVINLTSNMNKVFSMICIVNLVLILVIILK